MPAWPFSAKLVTAILIVAAVLGAIGTVVGFTSDGDSTADLDAQIATLTTERDDLQAQLAEYDARIATVTTERDAVAAELAELDAASDVATAQRDQLVAQLAALDTTLSAVTVERDDLATQLTQLDATFATLTADVAELDESVAVLTAERDQLLVDKIELQSRIAGETARANAAITERDALAALFPMTLEADLADVDLVGTYDIDYTKVYCDGFTTCGTVPTVDELKIVETAQGYLRLEMAGFVSAGLFRADGSLYAIASSTTAVPACGTTPRPAVITVTMYPHGLTVADDGTYAIDDLGASFTVQSDAIGSCPAGLAAYGGQLTP